MNKKVVAFIMGLGLLGLLGTQSMAIDGQVHLHKAAHHLQEALNEIENANNGPEHFGGNKKAAEDAIQAALVEVNNAIAYSVAHPSH